MSNAVDAMGWSIEDLVPRPIPAKYFVLSQAEREWRGRACLLLWLMGYQTRAAWLFALSKDPRWCDYMREKLPIISPARLDVEVLRRRLRNAAQAAY